MGAHFNNHEETNMIDRLKYMAQTNLRLLILAATFDVVVLVALVLYV